MALSETHDQLPSFIQLGSKESHIITKDFNINFIRQRMKKKLYLFCQCGEKVDFSEKEKLLANIL